MATDPVACQREKDLLIVYRDCTLEDAHIFPEFAAQIAQETDFTLHYEEKKYPNEEIQERWQEALNSSSEFYLGAPPSTLLASSSHLSWLLKILLY